MSIALKKIYIQYILLPSFFSLDVHRNLHKESWRKKERNKTNILYTRVRISVLRKVVEGLTKQKKILTVWLSVAVSGMKQKFRERSRMETKERREVNKERSFWEDCLWLFSLLSNLYQLHWRSQRGFQLSIPEHQLQSLLHLTWVFLVETLSLLSKIIANRLIG